MRVLMFSFFILLFNNGISQITSYNNRNFDFVGYDNNRPIYQFRSSEPNTIKNYSLFYANMDNNGNISFKTYRNSDKTILFFHNNIYVEESWINNETGYQINLFVNEKKVKSFTYKSRGFSRKNFNFVYSSKHKKLFFPYADNIENNVIRLAYIDFENNYELTLLPLLGCQVVLDSSEEYLYFSTTHLVDCYSDYPDDVFKVKINDWNNPKIVLEQASERGWSLLPNTEIIYSIIGVDGKSSKNAFYNTKSKTIKVIENYSASRIIIKYQNKYYFEIDWKRNTPIFYVPIKIPESFQITDNRFVCPDEKRVFMNISNNDKLFKETFITEYALYESDINELNKYTKQELRILRNAFYARQGYQFQSVDLKEFFSNQEWYGLLVKRNIRLGISNEEIILSYKDLERIRLIKEVEEN